MSSLRGGKSDRARSRSDNLWRYFTIYLRCEIAKRAGLTQKDAREQSRVSFGKVVEYQKRGAVHFHAVIRFDGPDGPDDPPPGWAVRGVDPLPGEPVVPAHRMLCGPD